MLRYHQENYIKFRVIIRQLTAKGVKVTVLGNCDQPDFWLPLNHVVWGVPREDLYVGLGCNAYIPGWLVVKHKQLCGEARFEREKERARRKKLKQKGFEYDPEIEFADRYRAEVAAEQRAEAECTAALEAEAERWNAVRRKAQTRYRGMRRV